MRYYAPLINIFFYGRSSYGASIRVPPLLIVIGALRPLPIAQEPSPQSPTINRQSFSDFTNNVIPNYSCRNCTGQSRKLLNNRPPLASSPRRGRTAASGQLSDCA